MVALQMSDMTNQAARALRLCAGLLPLLASTLLGQGFDPDPALPGGGRVLVVEHPGASVAFEPQAGPLKLMVDLGIRHFTSSGSAREAWASLIGSNEVVGIKVHSSPGKTSGTRPMVVEAVVQSLLQSGIPGGRVVIWDRRAEDLRQAGYPELANRLGVGITSAVEAGYDEAHFYESPLLGRLVFGDLEFGRKGEGVGRRSHVTKLLTRRVDKVIQISPLLNHNVASVSGSLYGMAIGGVDNILRFDQNMDNLAAAAPEIYALPQVGDKVALHIVDALICQYQGEERSLLHYSSQLRQLWFSKDPVALDLTALAELGKRRKESGAPAIPQNLKLYDNAALLDLGVGDISRIRIEKLAIEPKTPGS